MRAYEFILLEISDRIRKQVTDRWRSQDTNLTDANIKYYLDGWNRFSKTFPVDKRDITKLQFKEVESLVDAAAARQQLKGKAKPTTGKNPADAIYNQNNLEIYKGDLREKCILYGQGYSWCISRSDSNNLFYSYRMRANEPVFYFVFDLGRPRNDVWHAVVIYVDKDNIYHVATADNPGDQQMTWDEITKKHPKLKGLQSLFKPQPLAPQERDDYNKYKNKATLDQYQQFNINEKYKYIMFGHTLTDEQQAVTPNELIGTYAKNQTWRISKQTWDRLSGGDQKKVEQNQITYINRTQDSRVIRPILRAGIQPSEAVMLAAVENDGWAIEWILEAKIRPSEAVMLAAVKKNRGAIEYILDFGIQPGEAVMMAALKNNGEAIYYILKYGIQPSEKIMMAAVEKNGWTIEYILDFGIQPSEKIMMAAVENDGWAIRPILKYGIQPSEAMMMAAVKNNGRAIESILKAKILPSEEMMIAAVQQNGRAIVDILAAGIQPSEAVRRAADDWEDLL